ncbi:MAG: DUF4389 domain-containing protein [Thermoleophilaceae bacterium]|nr:DUF4389 domain-containing protein [Thermoleophilaceae bacterium]
MTQAPPAPPGYPVRVAFDHQEEYARWLPLVKWLLLLPHYVVLFFLGIAAFGATLAAFFAVLFTRRYPRALWDFVVGTHRWALRVTGYLYLMTDRYPPFSLEHDPAYPVRLEIDYPEEVDRWRAPFAWVLVIPYALAAAVILRVGELIVLFAFFTILFTKRFPKGMFDIVDVVFRWQLRASSYALFLVTRYPPLVWG